MCAIDRKVIDSTVFSRTALFSAILTVVELASFNLAWPLLPPIVVVPFTTSFVLAMTTPFIRTQWIVCFVAFLVTAVSKGGLLPGPFLMPIYGVIFQTRKVKLSGALSSIIHVVYGVCLAPLIFSMAPATVTLSGLKVCLGNYAVTFVTMITIFGLAGAISASLGYQAGLKLAGNLSEGRYYDP